MTQLRHAGLHPVATQAASTAVASGMVDLPEPVAGQAVVHSGTRVDVVVSSGPPSKALIRRPGAERQRGREQAEGRRLPANDDPAAKLDRRSGARDRDGSVSGHRGRRGQPRGVVVSGGPAQVHVPDLTGQPQAAAESALTNAGLAVGTVTDAELHQASRPAACSSQSPSGGSSVRSGQAGQPRDRAGAASEVHRAERRRSERDAGGGGARRAGLHPSAATVADDAPKSQVGRRAERRARQPVTQARKGATVTIAVGVKTAK